MATLVIDLDDGLTIGGETYKTAEIREYTAGDVIDAALASEKVVQGDDGPVLVSSPTLMDMALLGRQIVRIGEYKGPMDIRDLRKLSGADLAALQRGARDLDVGAARAASARGRLSGSPAGD